MTNVHRIRASTLISAIKEVLRNNGDIVLPKDSDIIKTSHGKEQAPQDPYWFLERMASIVRYAMRHGRVSLKGLVRKYSCRKNAGVRPSRWAGGSMFVIESAIRQLIKIGWFDFAGKDSIITPAAEEILGELMEKVE